MSSESRSRATFQRLAAKLEHTRSRGWAPILVLLVGLFATAGFTEVVSRVVHSGRAARFDDVVERAVATLDGRLASHQATVSAAAAVLSASSSIDAAEFERLTSNLTTHDLPPVLLAWCERQRGSGSCAVARAWSKTDVGALGVSSNLAELGDLPDAMARASRSRTSAVARIQLPGTHPGSELAFVFPVLGPAQFVGPDASAVRGFVVSVFSAEELLRKALDPSLASVDVEVHDAGSATASESLLLRTGPLARDAHFASIHTLGVGGRSLRLGFSSTSSFDGAGQQTLVRMVWVVGVLVTLLFTGVTWSEFRARARAERIGRRLAEADENLRRASRAKDQFLAMLGHELRNPLAAIANALQVIRMRKETDPGALRALVIAERQVTHQSRLVDDLLDLTRLGAGKMLLEPLHLDLRDVVRRAATSVRAALDERRHALTLELPSEPTPIRADATRLEQILVNLLTNAIKYTPERGAIELVVRNDMDCCEAVVTVRDNGIGIDDGALASIFTPFFQEAGDGVERRGGLGIGLTIVQRLVKLHGGRVEARSEGRGRGSEFEVRLPLAPRSAATARPIDAQETTCSTPVPRVLDVLIVEDLADNRDMLAEVVTLFGHRVREAETGAEALARAHERSPDLALVDLGLPDMDGLEVARALRSSPGGERLRLVAVTGFGSPEDRARALAAGYDEHMVKPVSVHRLVELLGPASGRTQGSERTSASTTGEST